MVVYAAVADILFMVMHSFLWEAIGLRIARKQITRQCGSVQLPQ